MGNENQVKRNQAVKVFRLYNKPNVIKREIPRDRIYMFIHLGTDKCTRKSKENKTKKKNKNGHKSKQYLWFRYIDATCIHVPINVHMRAVHACTN